MATRSLSPGRAFLLEQIGEEEFSQWVKRTAYRNGWNGVHTRYSQGAYESVHTLRRDGFSEAFGLPDWFFWHEDLEQSFFAELKTQYGPLSRHQKRMIPSLRKAGYVVFEWRPKDEAAIEMVFQYGISARTQ